MEGCDEISDFLRTRRARITPARAGLPHHGAHRRVPGLRREEVAMLAGVSVDYYVRLERGRLTHASDSVLEGIARALQLEPAERDHLFDLARTGPTGPGRPRVGGAVVLRPSVQRLLDAMTGAPAFVRNGRADLVGSNRLGRALYAPAFDTDVRPVNNARFAFLDPRARTFFPEWQSAAHDIVAVLRAELTRRRDDGDLAALVAELSAASADFRALWSHHDVRHHTTGTKRFCHPIVGELELTYEGMALSAAPDLTMFGFSAEPGSASEAALHDLEQYVQATPPGEDHDDPVGRPAAVG